MKFEDFIEKAKTVKEGKEIWISNPTLNQLMKESEEIRINQDGYLELRHYNTRIQISMKGPLHSTKNGVAYAEIINMAEYADYTGLKKKDYFKRPEKVKDIIIL